ncbi:hypothetical protein CEV33_1345 [Brucella grignonensis]|uniref:Uncharacterized protein n=1 Tax=Brucella grignonensis TaxID=94627 RepID=A0A256FBD0_9HYPH|nr:hypothetical protein CEV33_1345 [Brucella grignonensis]
MARRTAPFSKNQSVVVLKTRAFPAKVRSGFASDNAKNKEIEHFQ